MRAETIWVRIHARKRNHFSHDRSLFLEPYKLSIASTLLYQEGSEMGGGGELDERKRWIRVNKGDPTFQINHLLQ